MPSRRPFARLVRRLSRPTFGRLVLGSLVLHAAVLALVAWLAPELVNPAPPVQGRPPLIVDLPEAEPGRPRARVETPPAAPARPAAPPAVAAARPAPAAPAPAPTAPAPSAPVPPAVAAAPPPPAVAPAPAPPAPPEPDAEPTPAPAPPQSVARAPEPVEVAPRPSRPEPDAPTERPAFESPLAGQRFSLLGPRLETPALPSPPPGGGGTRDEGSGAGDAGRTRDGQAVVPLETPDPRYADYFLEIKRRIEANWTYPQEAIRRNQSGQGVVEFVLRKDGSLRVVEVVRTSGVPILDRYLENAIKFAAPFPPVPDRISTEGLPISLNFTYVLGGGYRLFGFR